MTKKTFYPQMRKGEHNVENSLLFSLRILRAVRSCKVSYKKMRCVRWL